MNNYAVLSAQDLSQIVGGKKKKGRSFTFNIFTNCKFVIVL